MSTTAHRRALAAIVLFIAMLVVILTLALAVHPTAGHARTAGPIVANLKCPAPGAIV